MLNRRSFLRATVIGAGSVLLGACRSDDQIELVDGAEFFPQSVASGDPTSESVVLWTRISDPEASDTLSVELEVATDEDFDNPIALAGGQRTSVFAKAEHDHCVKIRIDGLQPATTYYYRFIYPRDTGYHVSRVGRTRTAPLPDADVPVRFAFVSCQDYGGRYYNCHALLAEQELDFVVHLGDYIYETAADPSFQDEGGRQIVFDDQAGVIELGGSEGSVQAAASLDNYRQLYRTYRGDAAMQRVHERFAMIAIWDDHEFADDSHGATSTHFSGRVAETDEPRRKNASQAWYEYMPVDYLGEEEFHYDRAVPFPDDLEIWRNLRFGKHLELVMTDLRTRRADHLIPEDAYPGSVIVDQDTLQRRVGSIPESAGPYVDIQSYRDGMYLPVLREAAAAEDYETSDITGNISVGWINRVLTDTGSSVPPIEEAEQADLPRGYAYLDLGKSSLYSRLGSRYVLAKEVFDIYAAEQFEETGGSSELMMGEKQRDWFLGVMHRSEATWKVWGNEFCLIPLQIDLSELPIDDAFRREFYISTDQWDGFRNRRDALLGELVDVDNLVAITGDVHAFFAGTPWPADAPENNIIEFVTSSISSKTYQEVLTDQVNTTSLKDVPGAEQLASAIGELLTLSNGPNPHLGYAAPGQHGFVVVELDGSYFEATHFAADKTIVAEPRYDQDLDARFQRTRFRVEAGKRTLFRHIDGTWKRWDPASYRWV